MFHGEPTQDKVGYMHASGGLDKLYEFVKGNGWDKITEPAVTSYGGRACFITTIDGSILHFDGFDESDEATKKSG